jgi:hypothetical protein
LQASFECLFNFIMDNAEHIWNHMASVKRMMTSLSLSMILSLFACPSCITIWLFAGRFCCPWFESHHRSIWWTHGKWKREMLPLLFHVLLPLKSMCCPQTVPWWLSSEVYWTYSLYGRR